MSYPNENNQSLSNLTSYDDQQFLDLSSLPQDGSGMPIGDGSHLNYSTIPQPDFNFRVPTSNSRSAPAVPTGQSLLHHTQPPFFNPGYSVSPGATANPASMYGQNPSPTRPTLRTRAATSSDLPMSQGIRISSNTFSSRTPQPRRMSEERPMTSYAAEGRRASGVFSRTPSSGSMNRLYAVPEGVTTEDQMSGVEEMATSWHSEPIKTEPDNGATPTHSAEDPTGHKHVPTPLRVSTESLHDAMLPVQGSAGSMVNSGRSYSNSVSSSASSAFPYTSPISQQSENTMSPFQKGDHGFNRIVSPTSSALNGGFQGLGLGEGYDDTTIVGMEVDGLPQNAYGAQRGMNHAQAVFGTSPAPQQQQQDNRKPVPLFSGLRTQIDDNEDSSLQSSRAGSSNRSLSQNMDESSGSAPSKKRGKVPAMLLQPPTRSNPKRGRRVVETGSDDEEADEEMADDDDEEEEDPGTSPMFPLNDPNQPDSPEPISMTSTNNKFVHKLYNMLAARSARPYIYWVKTGTAFAIPDPNAFQDRILNQWYKHSNFSSFVRQLNMYGFHKRRPTEAETRRKKKRMTEEQTVWVFSSPQFIYGRIDLLDVIRRKPMESEASKREAASKAASALSLAIKAPPPPPMTIAMAKKPSLTFPKAPLPDTVGSLKSRVESLEKELRREKERNAELMNELERRDEMDDGAEGYSPEEQYYPHQHIHPHHPSMISSSHPHPSAPTQYSPPQPSWPYVNVNVTSPTGVPVPPQFPAGFGGHQVYGGMEGVGEWAYQQQQHQGGAGGPFIQGVDFGGQGSLRTPTNADFFGNGGGGGQMGGNGGYMMDVNHANAGPGCINPTPNTERFTLARSTPLPPSPEDALAQAAAQRSGGGGGQRYPDGGLGPGSAGLSNVPSMLSLTSARSFGSFSSTSSMGGYIGGMGAPGVGQGEEDEASRYEKRRRLSVQVDMAASARGGGEAQGRGMQSAGPGRRTGGGKRVRMQDGESGHGRSRSESSSASYVPDVEVGMV